MSDSYETIYEFDSRYYQSQIETTEFFTLDEKIDGTIYQREKYKLIENIARYMFSINNGEYQEFGAEIWELSERCLKYYDSSLNIPFLSYFLKAWEKEYKKCIYYSRQKEKISGIHVPEGTIKKINTHLLRAKKMNADYLSEEFAQKVAGVINWNVNDVAILIQQLEYGTVSDILQIEEEEISIIDLHSNEWENCIEKILLNEDIDDAIALIHEIDKKYDCLQERQKEIISMLLTSSLYNAVRDEPQLITMIKEMHFYSDEIFNICIARGSISHRDIADICCVKEQHVSRSWNLFKQRLMER